MMDQTRSTRKPPIPLERTSQRRDDPQGATRNTIPNEFHKYSLRTANKLDESFPYISESSHHYLKDRVKALSSENEELHLQLVSLREQMSAMQTRISRLGFDNKRLDQENQMYQRSLHINATEVQHASAGPLRPSRTNETRPPVPKRISTLQYRNSAGQSSSMTSGHASMVSESYFDVNSLPGDGNNTTGVSSSMVNAMRQHILKQSMQIKDLKQLIDYPPPSAGQYSLNSTLPNFTLPDPSMPSSSTQSRDVHTPPQSRSVHTPPQSLRSYTDEYRPLPLQATNRNNEKPSHFDMLILDKPANQSRSPITEVNASTEQRDSSDEEIAYSRPGMLLNHYPVSSSNGISQPGMLLNRHPVSSSNGITDFAPAASYIHSEDMNDDSPELLQSEFDILSRMDRQEPYGNDFPLTKGDIPLTKIKACPTCRKSFEISDQNSKSRFQNHCLECIEKENDPPETRNSPEGSPPPRDRTCPVCSALFPAAIRQSDYERHVIAHFEDDDIRQTGFEPISDPPVVTVMPNPPS